MPQLMYIHGLDASPHSGKIAILESLGFRVDAPQLYYREEENILAYLYKRAQANPPHYLVGSSAGGLMAYFLAKYLNCPALLFNPALNYEDFAIKQQLHLDESIGADYYYNIVLGEQDNIVPASGVVAYLEKHEPENRYTYERLAHVGHRIDLPTFREACEKYVYGKKR